MEYKMSNSLKQVTYEIRGPIAEEAEKMSRNGIPIIKLNTGNPAPFGLHAPAGGKVVHYACDEQSNWFPDVADIRRKVTKRTKGIVIINPDNPTGAVYPKHILEGMIQVAREHNLIIFSDEIYDRMVMDGISHISTAALAPDLFVVTFNGLSKSHRIAGFRCGWICLSGNKAAAKEYIEGINLLASMRLKMHIIAKNYYVQVVDCMSRDNSL